MFLMSLFCLTNPDNDRIRLLGQETLEDILGIKIRFLAGDAFLGLVVFDFLGVCLGWRVLGHAAHLSGAATAIYYVEMGGKEHVKAYQSFVSKKYAAVRQAME